jgi:hypothetical protein
VVVERHIVTIGIVSHVQVVGKGWELSSNRVNLLDERRDSKLNALAADSELIGLHKLGDLTILKAELLGLS